MTRRRMKILALVLVLMLAVQGLAVPAYAATPAGAVDMPAVFDGGDTQPEDASVPRSQASLDLQEMLEADPELMALMEKSIAAAAAVNPDRETNPVQSVQEFYDFLDWAVTCMPWSLMDDEEHPTLYSSIDQSVCYFWFLLDQPLEELEGLGYYYPTLQYHEPIAGWIREYADDWGNFLNTPMSWNDDCFRRAMEDPSMNMQYGWYGEENIWNTFNEFFSRHLISPSMRPIALTSVVSPADSEPQGIWDIDEAGWCSRRALSSRAWSSTRSRS